MQYKEEKCFDCGNMQEINDRNLYQDIGGQWVICGKCGSNFGVEPKSK